MKKIKLNSTTVFKYIYLVIFFGGIFILFQLYNFLNEHVYKTFAVDQDFLSTQVKKTSEVINSEKFEEIKINLDNKLKRENSKPADTNDIKIGIETEKNIYDSSENKINLEE